MEIAISLYHEQNCETTLWKVKWDWDCLFKTKSKGAHTAAHKELSKTDGGVPNQDSEIPPQWLQTWTLTSLKSEKEDYIPDS